MAEAPETRKAALAGGPDRKSSIIIDADNATDLADRQAHRLARLYAVSYATAATLARLAYAVAR